MQSSVTNRQMVFYVFITCVTFTMETIPLAMASSAGRGAWVTLLLSSFVFGAMAAVIVRLGKMYEGKTLFEYSRDIAGRFIPYVLGIYYALYFLFIDTSLCDLFTQMVHTNFLLNTPPWALILILMPVLGYIAYKGVNKAARLAEVFLLWFVVIAVTVNITMLIEGDFHYLLPLFNFTDVGKYIAAVKDAFPAFLGIEVLVVVPMSKKNIKAPKAAFFTMVGIGILYISAVYGCYAMIGFNEIAYHDIPLIEAVRLVEYPTIEFFQRIDVLYMTFGFVRTLIGIGIVNLTVVELICKLLPKVKRIAIVIAVSVAVALISVFTAGIQSLPEIFNTVASYAGIVAAFLIPLSLFVTAKVKKHGKKGAK